MTGSIEVGFWRGRRVFLTGHTGFKGAWLLFWLHHLGAEVHGYSLPPDTDPNLFEALGLAQFGHHRIGDIRDLDNLKAAIRAADPEIVFHLAAQPLVRRAFKSPAYTFEVNVQGTVHLLEACRGRDAQKAVVVVTSDKCYENLHTAQGYNESDRLGGREPYSASKAAAELVTRAYRESYLHPRTGVATARAGNVIGGGDWCADRLIPDAVRAFSRAEELVIRNPGAVRPWQYVLEPLSGYLMLAQALAAGGRVAEAWNFGPPSDQLVTVGVLVEMLASAWSSDCRWRAEEEPGACHEAGLLMLRSDKAHERLGWSPRMSLGEAVAATVSWYKAYYRGGELKSLLLEHFREYECGS